MISVFTIPKPFAGNIAVLQRNAIKSWMKLSPAIEIILMGEGFGVRETAEKFGLRHVPDIAVNDFGTPLISDVFSKARLLAENRLVCYVNTDIILTTDFLTAARQISGRFNRFLGIGRRWDLDLSDPIDFSDDTRWEAGLLDVIESRGRLHGPAGIDYFLFPAGVYDDIPPFAVGRTAWDNWLVYNARNKGLPVIDLTDAARVVHQNHDYAHHSDGAEGIKNGLEAQRNRLLSGGTAYYFTVDDANWRLDHRQRLKRKMSLRFLGRQWRRLPVLHPDSGRKNPIVRRLWRLLIAANVLTIKIHRLTTKLFQ